MDEPIKDEDINDYRQYVWDYFHYHASQRLTTFNFYIIICSLMATAYFTALKDVRTAHLGIVLGLLILLLSFIFWKLDIRNRQMIENAEEALKCIESENTLQDTNEEPHVLKIFTRDKRQTDIAKKGKRYLICKIHWGYAKCFNWVFFVFGILGILAALYPTKKLLYAEYTQFKIAAVVEKYSSPPDQCCWNLIADTHEFWRDVDALHSASLGGDPDAIRTILVIEAFTDGAVSERMPNLLRIVKKYPKIAKQVICGDDRLKKKYSHWIE